MIINSMWIGDRLSRLEYACIKSHLIVGHEYHLWCYQPIENVPEGVVIRDGREILPEEDIFSYKVGAGKGSYSAFSNYFRYKLLLDVGGCWADTDVAAIQTWVALQHRPYAIASEEAKTYSHPTTCVILAPRGSELSQYCWEQSQKYDKDTLQWGVIGPGLLAQAVRTLKLGRTVVAHNVFCPINWPDYEKLLFEDAKYDIGHSLGVHFWNEMWRRNGVNKEIEPWPNSVYGKLLHDVLLQQGFCQLLQACREVSTTKHYSNSTTII
jgi:hypothetical protein